MAQKHKTDYAESKDDELIALASHVIRTLENNHYIKKTALNTTELQILLDAYEEAVESDKTHTAAGQEVKNALTHALGIISNVLRAAGISFSGSNAHRHFIPIKVDNAKRNKKCVRGEITINFKRIPDIETYKICYCDKEGLTSGVWQSCLSTGTPCVIGNLEKGKEYFFKVTESPSGVEKNACHDYCDIISRVVVQ